MGPLWGQQNAISFRVFLLQNCRIVVFCRFVFLVGAVKWLFVTMVIGEKKPRKNPKGIKRVTQWSKAWIERWAANRREGQESGRWNPVGAPGAVFVESCFFSC